MNTSSSIQELTAKELSAFFHLPISEAAKALNTCETALKKLCRRKNINRWPYRKIASINALIASLEKQVLVHSSASAELISLLAKREYLLQNPNEKYNSVVPKYYINSFTTKHQARPSSATKTIVKPKHKIQKKFISPFLTVQVAKQVIDSEHIQIESSSGTRILSELKSWEISISKLLPYKRISFDSMKPTVATKDIGFIDLTHSLRASSQELVCWA